MQLLPCMSGMGRCSSFQNAGCARGTLVVRSWCHSGELIQQGRGERQEAPKQLQRLLRVRKRYKQGEKNQTEKTLFNSFEFLGSWY